MVLELEGHVPLAIDTCIEVEAELRQLGLCVAEACKGIRHVTEIEPSEVTCFMKNSFAFGGINASLVCRV